MTKRLGNQCFQISIRFSAPTLLLSTALHEIGHALGFVSGVDRPNFPSPFFKRADSPDGSLENLWSTSRYSNYWWSLVNRIKQTTPLDLMRYSIESMNGGTQRGFQDSSMGGYYGNLFLSLDGVNSLGSLAEGKDIALAGDGSQASHWKEEAIPQGLMDSHMALGERAQFSSRDLRAFDALGWDRNFSSVTLNYSTLLSQARQALANRIGRTVTWMNANQTIAADLLDQDRLSDVNLMLTNSADIYEGRRNQTTGSWQELFSLLDEQGLLDSLASSSSNSVKATVRNDLLAGSTDDDELSGLRGNDQMIGFKGNDTLRGNKGADTLFGSLGRDVLIGGKGDDLLIGGAGADIFAVQRNAGFDVVEDFTDGQDKLLLLGGLQFEQLGIQQKGQDTLISYEGNSLMLLKSLDATLLTAADIVTSV